MSLDFYPFRWGSGAVRQDGRSSAQAQQKVAELKEHFQLGSESGKYPCTEFLDEEVLKRLKQRERDSLDIQHAVLEASTG